MKSIILLKMRLWVFLVELPLTALLFVCWKMTDKVESLLGLWPLIIALAALIVFLALYFFRLVEISWEEIRDIGMFTRRDSAIINEGKALVIRMMPRGGIKLTLLGPVGEAALYDWTSDEDASSEIGMYRGNAYGGERAVRKLLTYFGAAEDDLDAILSEDGFRKDYAYATVSAAQTDEGREIRIDVNETLLANGTPVAKKKADTAE